MKKTIAEYINEIHQDSTLRGFHEDFHLNRFLMLVITELSEAVQADRVLGCVDAQTFKYFKDRVEMFDEFPVHSFRINIKNSVEVELADALIRIMDLMGALKITNLPTYFEDIKIDTVVIQEPDFPSQCFGVIRSIFDRKEFVVQKVLESLFIKIYSLAIGKEIDIIKFIDWKVEYNKIKPRLHGKNY